MCWLDDIEHELHSVFWYPIYEELLFSDIKTNIDLVHMDDARGFFFSQLFLSCKKWCYSILQPDLFYVFTHPFRLFDFAVICHTGLYFAATRGRAAPLREEFSKLDV